MVDIIHPVVAERAPSKPWRASKPATIVVSLAVGLIVVIFAIFAVLCVQGYNTTITQAHAKAQAAAEIIGDEISWFLGGSRLALQQIAGTAAVPGDVTPAQKAALDAALRPFSGAGSVGLYDATGQAWCSSGAPGLPADISKTDFFQELAAGKSFTISRQRSDAATGKAVFVVAQRLGTDRFGGVVALVTDGSLLRQVWLPQSLGEESTASVIREDGWLVGRYPPLPDAMNLSKAPPFTSLAGEERGVYDSPRSPADGIGRIVAFRRLPSLGIVTLASISQDAVLAPLWAAIITVTWLMAPIALALLVGSLVTARIINQSERTNAKLAAALAHNDVLFREIHHRVKNNLQSVASLLQMQPIDRAIKTNMGQRIAAMSAVHEHIYRSTSFTTVQVKPYLETLIQNIRAGGDPKVRVVEQVDDLSVDKDSATPLGLILNEVLSNAFKHAFPEGREGTITVRLAATDDGRGRLVVEDNGVGFDPAVPAKGIGQRLIRALTEQLGGTSEMTAGANAGSRFELVFPLAKAAAA